MGAFAVTLPEDYTPIEIRTAEDFASLTPQESVNYAFIVADGVELTADGAATLLPAVSVWVEAEG